MEKTIFERRKEFLDETVAYYSENVSRRAHTEGRVPSCFYRTNDNRKCAIGRHIPDELYTPELENQSLLDIVNTRKFKNTIPDNIVELGYDFLRNVQMLHDGNANWDEKGLTKSGKNNYNVIVKQYCNEEN